MLGILVGFPQLPHRLSTHHTHHGKKNACSAAGPRNNCHQVNDDVTANFFLETHFGVFGGGARWNGPMSSHSTCPISLQPTEILVVVV